MISLCRAPANDVSLLTKAKKKKKNVSTMAMSHLDSEAL
jgi:hypothetical protein